MSYLSNIFKRCHATIDKKTNNLIVKAPDYEAAVWLSHQMNSIVAIGTLFESPYLIIRWPEDSYMKPCIIPIRPELYQNLSLPDPNNLMPHPEQTMTEQNLIITPNNSTLDLSTHDIDVTKEVLNNPYPTAILRIDDRCLMFANKLFFDVNQKKPKEMIGRSIDGLCTPDELGKLMNRLSQDRTMHGYEIEASYYRIQDGFEARDLYKFVSDIKRFEFLGDPCYAFTNWGSELIKTGEASSWR